MDARIFDTEISVTNVTNIFIELPSIKISEIKTMQKSIIMGIIALIAIFLTPTVSTIQAQTQQPQPQQQQQQAQTQQPQQSQAITPTAHAYDIQKKAVPMVLGFINDDASGTIAQVQGIALGQENVVNLQQDGDFIVATTPQGQQILKVTLTDTNGQNIKQLQQRSTESPNYWQTTAIPPGQYFGNALVKFPDGRQGVFQVVVKIAASAQAAAAAVAAPLTPAQLTEINTKVVNTEIKNRITSSVSDNKPSNNKVPNPDPTKIATFPAGTRVATLADGTLVLREPGKQTKVFPPQIVIPGQPPQRFTTVTLPNGELIVLTPSQTDIVRPEMVPQSASIGLRPAQPPDGTFVPPVEPLTTPPAPRQVLPPVPGTPAPTTGTPPPPPPPPTDGPAAPPPAPTTGTPPPPPPPPTDGPAAPPPAPTTGTPPPPPPPPTDGPAAPPPAPTTGTPPPPPTGGAPGEPTELPDTGIAPPPPPPDTGIAPGEPTGPGTQELDCEAQGLVEDEDGQCVLPTEGEQEQELDCESQGLEEQDGECVLPDTGDEGEGGAEIGSEPDQQEQDDSGEFSEGE
jgi:hypothetical protein